MESLKTKDYICNLLKARFPMIYISTWEENRVTQMIEDLAIEENKIKTVRKVYLWSQTDGITAGRESVKNTTAPLAALDYIAECNEPSVFILKDFHVYLNPKQPNEYIIIRKLRDMVNILRESEKPKNIIFVSPMLQLPEELQKEVTVVELDFPNIYELESLLDEMIAVNKENPNITISLSETEKRQLCKTALGLTLQEAENAIARAMVQKGQLSIQELDIILEEKRQVIRKTGILEFIKSDLKLEDVGGLENLKRWLIKRNKSWKEEALKYNIPSPKGVLITGVPGCGKSLTAKAISAMWQLPLLRLDMGKIFSGLVGSSEENMRKAIRTAEAVSPSILWIDEIEKGFSGNGAGDGGTSTRIFGTFLTWMQEKTKPVFVVATANNINKLPSELLRKGRFDEIFFVDLPTLKERMKIFEVHLKKRLKNETIIGDIKQTEDELKKLASLTEGFVGAEIEESVIAALFEAFAEDREINMSDLERAIKNMVPLSITQAEQITAIREWANVRAVAATAKEDRTEYVSEKEEVTKTLNSNDNFRHSRGGRTIDF
ncbi:AAA family ATPase [Sellimonas intestinalis]|uniref:AAA family ATPase n=1 Tax=Sellimonas intestinalis TaxID=1653434 RepID=UPI0015ECB10D|nr:AAA family ATPase [Sellimonas intestinalis]MBA2214182.1 AAA family ATPase [Sellimonas intestinalis]